MKGFLPYAFWCCLTTIAMVGLCIFLLSGGKFEAPPFAALRSNVLIAFIAGILLLAILVGLVCVYVFRGRNEKTDKSDKCAFCGRAIRSSEVNQAIKGHVVCGQCYKKIEEEKAKM